MNTKIGDKDLLNDNINNLVQSLYTNDPALILTEIGKYNNAMRDPSIGAILVSWITEPNNITMIHSYLTTNLNIPPKLLSIRRMNVSRAQRAVLLVRALEAAIKKVYFS